MKGIMLLYGVSMLVIGYAMMVDAKRANPFSMCSITEEKDAALYKCLSEYRVKQREAMEKIKNHAGVKNHTLLYQLFKDSLKCFSDKSRTQKFCYLRAMGQRFRQNYPRKGEEMEIISAAVMYESFKGYTKSMMEECKLNQETAPFFVSCLQDIDPEAKKIMAEKVSHESYKRMVELMISTKRCYMNLTSDQLACIVKQSQDYQKGQVEKMKKDMQLMVEKLKDCKINEEKIEAVLACVKPKANEMMKKAMKLFEQPELIDEVWNISEDMKQCFDKYPDVKKCSNLQKHGRSEKHGPRMLNPFHFENVTNGLLHYIQVKSKNMLRDCKVRPTEMPSLFVCLAKKYKENKDVQSTDPKKKFIGMMMLMNTSAECFKNVTAEQGVCLWKNKQDMIRFVNFNAQSLGKIMDQLLGGCNATSEMVSCVDAKKSRLQELAKTILTNPDDAETMWDLGASLKNCLTDATIRTCVLSKKDKSQERFGRRGCSSHECYGDMNMQKHIVE